MAEPKAPPMIIKVEAIKTGEEFAVPDGWILKDLVSTPIGPDNEASSMVFHVVLMKLPPQPPAPKPKLA